MAELDRFERAFGPGWRKAYQRARMEDVSLEEVADILRESLTRELREGNGVPGFREVKNVVEEMVQRNATGFDSAGQEDTALVAAFDNLEKILRACEGHRHTKIASNVAKELIVQQCQGDVGLVLAKGICNELLEHRFFANARQKLVAQGKCADYAEAQQWQSHVEQIMQPTITEIAGRFTRNPDAEGLRAPNRIVKPKSTTDLLKEDLTSI